MIKICSYPGCGGEVHARGVCRNHYTKIIRYGSVEGKPRYDPPSVRFWRSVDKRGPDECWNWTGMTVREYGRISVNGSSVQAHRFAYQEFKGPIPRGMVILHKCDNPACVNPAHLSIGTQAENLADMRSKGRARDTGPKGERSHLAKLTEDQVREIRASSLGPVATAQSYGIHRDTVRLIRQRKIWDHLT
jgi:HNH endonuclease